MLQNFGLFCCISWEFLEQKDLKLLELDQNCFYLIEQASGNSKMTLSIIVLKSICIIGHTLKSILV